MTIEQQIADLTTATNDLLEMVNVKKIALDNAVDQALEAVEEVSTFTFALSGSALSVAVGVPFEIRIINKDS